MKLRVAALLCGLCAGALGCAPSAAPERIVLIVIDTLRADHVSAYVGRVPTPNIDALAERGQLALAGLGSFHQTTMSMGAMFTGRTPSIDTGEDRKTVGWNGRTWCGMARFADGPELACIPSTVPTLGEQMRAAGYWTIGVASNSLLFAPAGFERGFEQWVEVGRPEDGFDPLAPVDPQRDFALRPGRVAGIVNAAVERALAERAHDRIFLYVHYMDVHDYGQLPSPPEAYAANVVRVDQGVGRLLELLEREQLLEGAQIVLTSDHGERFGEKHLVRGGPSHLGNPSFEEVLRVPMIFAPPLLDDPTRTVRTQDLFGLLVRAAGNAQNAVAPDRDEVFLTELKWRTYRSGRWKSFVERASGNLLLVDLDADPREQHDASGDHAEIAAEHEQRMQALAASFATPLDSTRKLTEEDRRRLKAQGYLD